ncbi:putative aminoacid/polyamine transporter, permease protein [Streptomyces venezuelae]|nr:putative aminoacid/polyamine transporter, permease protein [Streptomyces venezuelae]CUM35843.1 FIG01103396: hypothetical protein [Streptomyces venezuelae]
MSALTTENGATSAVQEPPDTGARHKLTAVTGLAALSLDAMASVAYGPEAIVLVLAAAGGYGLGFTLPVTLAIAGLLTVLVASYRQVIAAFPDGGGSYAVAKAHLGRRTTLVAAGSLVLDYVLNVAVAVTAGVAALTSAFPELYGDRLWICLAVLVLITGVNLRGIVDSARAFIVPTAVFIGAILVLIVVGLFRDAPVSTAASTGHASVLADNATTVGALLLLKAFASGCSALTGDHRGLLRRRGRLTVLRPRPRRTRSTRAADPAHHRGLLLRARRVRLRRRAARAHGYRGGGAVDPRHRHRRPLPGDHGVPVRRPTPRGP